MPPVVVSQPIQSIALSQVSAMPCMSRLAQSMILPRVSAMPSAFQFVRSIALPQVPSIVMPAVVVSQPIQTITLPQASSVQLQQTTNQLDQNVGFLMAMDPAEVQVMHQASLIKHVDSLENSLEDFKFLLAGNKIHLDTSVRIDQLKKLYAAKHAIDRVIARLELDPGVEVKIAADSSLKGNEATAVLFPYGDDKDEDDSEEEIE